jgi:hypothetical protein
LSQSGAGGNSGLTFGGGLLFGSLAVDYAFAPGPDFTGEHQHRFSLSVAF